MDAHQPQVTAAAFTGGALLAVAIVLGRQAAAAGALAAKEPATWNAPRLAAAAPAAPIYLPTVSVAWEPLEPLGQIGGLASAVTVDGSLAAVAAGRRLALADLTDLRSPRFVGQSPALDYGLTDVILSGGYAWASVPVGPLLGLDVRNPRRPRLTSITKMTSMPPLPRQARWFSAAPLAAAPGRIYMGVHGLVHMVDVSDPRRPAEVSSIALAEGNPLALALRGDHVFVVEYMDDDSEGRLVTIDWSEARAPQVVGVQGLRINPTYELAVSGDWLVAERYTAQFYDVSDPSTPRAVGWAGESEWADIMKGERLPGVDGALRSVAAKGRRVWLLGDSDGGGTLWELRMRPEWPPEVVRASSVSRGWHLAAGPDYAAVVDGAATTRLETVGAGAAAAATGSAERLGAVRWALLTARRAYVSRDLRDATVTILDIEDPRRPAVAGVAPAKPEVAYADDESMIVINTPRVEYWDVRDPQQPRLAAEYQTTGISVNDTGVVQGGTVFVPGHSTLDGGPAGGVFMLPLDGATPPRFWSLSHLTRVATFGDRIVVGDSARYFVLDVSSAEPAVVAEGHFARGRRWPEGFEVVGDYLVMVDGQRMEVHRLAGPGAPELHAEFELPVAPYSVAALGRTIVAARDGLFVWALDDDFRTLRVLGESDWPARNVSLWGDVVAAGSTSVGIRFFRLRSEPQGRRGPGRR